MPHQDNPCGLPTTEASPGARGSAAGQFYDECLGAVSLGHCLGGIPMHEVGMMNGLDDFCWMNTIEYYPSIAK